MITHVDGHTRLVAHSTLTVTGRRAIQLNLGQDGSGFGIQITPELYARMGELLEEPKDDSDDDSTTSHPEENA
ncbi:hypothetical protein GTA26_05365 [Rhodococcus hoagii]|nr:hypothetical protein [Prescottella equi]NKZ94850.1 hypothetical protein [Prescottella equi]